MDTWIVAGLGNPGARYAGTRHDLGFALVSRLADEAGLSFRRATDAELAGPMPLARDMESTALLVLPRLYVNRSGAPLARQLEEMGLGPERLLVACDDVNLPLGTIRLRESGSSGGHNGLKSIIVHVGEGFPRLRMGVGSAGQGEDLAEHVLAAFEDSEDEGVREMLQRAAELVRGVLRTGVVKATTSTPAGPEQEETGMTDD